jgi:hypothetical protein
MRQGKRCFIIYTAGQEYTFSRKGVEAKSNASRLLHEAVRVQRRCFLEQKARKAAHV